MFRQFERYLQIVNDQPGSEKLCTLWCFMFMLWRTQVSKVSDIHAGITNMKITEIVIFRDITFLYQIQSNTFEEAKLAFIQVPHHLLLVFCTCIMHTQKREASSFQFFSRDLGSYLDRRVQNISYSFFSTQLAPSADSWSHTNYTNA